MKKHTWSEQDDELLLKSIEECSPLFDHFRGQGGQYSGNDVWNSIAGRMLPSVVVTGAACKRRYARITEERPDAWKTVSDMVNAYERDISEAMFDNTSEMLKKMEALLQMVNQNTIKLQRIDRDLKEIMKMWE